MTSSSSSSFYFQCHFHHPKLRQSFHLLPYSDSKHQHALLLRGYACLISDFPFCLICCSEMCWRPPEPTCTSDKEVFICWLFYIDVFTVNKDTRGRGNISEAVQAGYFSSCLVHYQHAAQDCASCTLCTGPGQYLSKYSICICLK